MKLREHMSLHRRLCRVQCAIRHLRRMHLSSGARRRIMQRLKAELELIDIELAFHDAYLTRRVSA